MTWSPNWPPHPKSWVPAIHYPQGIQSDFSNVSRRTANLCSKPSGCLPVLKNTYVSIPRPPKPLNLLPEWFHDPHLMPRPPPLLLPQSHSLLNIPSTCGSLPHLDLLYYVTIVLPFYKLLSGESRVWSSSKIHQLTVRDCFLPTLITISGSPGSRSKNYFVPLNKIIVGIRVLCLWACKTL